MGKWNMRTFVRETLTERPFGRQKHIRAENIETDLQETGWQTWIGLIWLRTGTCGRVMQTWWSFMFDIMWRVYRLAREPLASQEGLYPMELSSQSVSWLSIIRYLVSFPCIYWRSPVPVYTQAHNTHHAFLHNVKFFFKSLYCSSETLTARSCTIFSKCNKVADKNLTHLKTFDKYIWKNTYWSRIWDPTCHIIHSNTRTFLSSTNCQKCYNKMWIARQTQNCLLQKSGNIHLNEISLITDLVYLCT